jgi:tRNA(adenine34) deaminase
MTRFFCYGSITGQALEARSEKKYEMKAVLLHQDTGFMRLALEEAQRAAAAGEVPIGAVLVLEGTIVGRGHNRRETWQDPTAHAEMIAIRSAAAAVGSWRLLNSILYVTMEPCAMCIGAAILARVTRVVYAATDPKGGACGSILNIPQERRLNHQLQVQGDVLSHESRLLLQEFFQKLRRPRERWLSSASQGREGAIDDVDTGL